jgi:methionyl-tRNA formyltransferase
MITNSLSIVFAGTPHFASCALSALFEANFSILGVYTQPDRPAGRGQQITTSAVKLFATSVNLPIYQPHSLRQPEAQASLAKLQPDLLIVAAYGLILPKTVLDIPRLGCINIHASLLPRWRGAAPIQRSIEAGDQMTGITLMLMDEGLDTGKVINQSHCPIFETDTSETLYQRLSILGAETLLATLTQYHPQRGWQAVSQDHTQASYAHKISKEEAWLDWTLPATLIDRKIRAFQPWPVAQTRWEEKVMRIWQTEVNLSPPCTGSPGEIMQMTDTTIWIATGEGWLGIQSCQLPGGKRLPISSFLAGHHQQIRCGQILS